MDFKELSKERYSVRQYKDIPLKAEDLNTLLQTSNNAPSVYNKQTHIIYVIQEKSQLIRARKYTISHYDAPCILIIGYEKESIFQEMTEKLIHFNNSIILTHLMLQAADIGVGSVWVDTCDFEGLADEFNLPDNFVPLSLMPLGYPADDSQPADKHYERKDLSEIVRYL